MTKQRDLVYNVVRSADGHLSAEGIFMILREQEIRISIATVYRNLGLLCEAGELRRIAIPGEPDRYDKNTTPHDHLICAVCGKAVDVFLGDLKTLIEEKAGTDILSYELSIRYVCPECKQKSSQTI